MLKEPFGPRPAYKADIARLDGSVWTFRGVAEGQFSYLLRSQYSRLLAGTRLLVTGELQAGGFSVGFLLDEQWSRQAFVTRPGRFRVDVEVPEEGDYSVVIANYLTEPMRTSFQVDRIGFYHRDP
jgi:hypothetical protein